MIEQKHTGTSQAFVFAGPEGYVRVCADEGTALEPQLRELGETEDDAGHLRRVLTALPRR